MKTNNRFSFYKNEGTDENTKKKILVSLSFSKIQRMNKMKTGHIMSLPILDYTMQLLKIQIHVSLSFSKSQFLKHSN